MRKINDTALEDTELQEKEMKARILGDYQSNLGVVQMYQDRDQKNYPRDITKDSNVHFVLSYIPELNSGVNCTFLVDYGKTCQEG